jgi:hypothetical protein|tara:strand:+ start:582 stop:1004 length:423 start_codon:yes stop_codon:yes gene_type:complete
MQKYIHEIFEETCKFETRDERIAYLKENAFKQVKSILQLCYNDKIELDLPYGRPPFEVCPEGREPSPLKNAFGSIGACVKANKVNRTRKEKIFIGILEQLCEKDAHILCAAKDGTITTLGNKTYSKMTKSLVEACFPEIL